MPQEICTSSYGIAQPNQGDGYLYTQNLDKEVAIIVHNPRSQLIALGRQIPISDLSDFFDAIKKVDTKAPGQKIYDVSLLQGTTSEPINQQTIDTFSHALSEQVGGNGRAEHVLYSTRGNFIWPVKRSQEVLPDVQIQPGQYTQKEFTGDQCTIRMKKPIIGPGRAINSPVVNTYGVVQDWNQFSTYYAPFASLSDKSLGNTQIPLLMPQQEEHKHTQQLMRQRFLDARQGILQKGV